MPERGEMCGVSVFVFVRDEMNRMNRTLDGRTRREWKHYYEGERIEREREQV